MKILCSCGKRSGSLRTRMGKKSAVTSAYRDDRLPGPGDFDPPEYDEPDEVTIESEIEVEIDADVEVDSESNFIFVDDLVDWAFNPDDPSGDWYDSETGVYLGDGQDIADHVQDVIAPRIPAKPGVYRVKGVVLVAFDISEIYRYNNGTFNDPEYDDDTSNAKATFNFRNSRVEELTVN